MIKRMASDSIMGDQLRPPETTQTLWQYGMEGFKAGLQLDHQCNFFQSPWISVQLMASDE